MEIMNHNIGLKQFFKANTPKTAQIIGDISLILAFVSSVPILLSTAGVAVPTAVITASVYATTGGSLIKVFSKYIGIKDEEAPKDAN